MTNRRYLQGRASEYLAQRELEGAGWETARAAGSKGVVDIIAWRAERVRFIQIKSFKTRPGSYEKDLSQLRDMILPPGATAELWIRQHGSRSWYKQLTVKEKSADERSDTATLGPDTGGGS